jgi:CRP-like cAMP-binding protein
MSNKGYISETISTFQIGLRSKGQWVGEDILILNNLPFPFSIIAKTEVEALAISKQDLKSKIPSDFRHILEENARDKNNWLQKRIREITKTSQVIYKQDYKQLVYDKILNQLLNKHPLATNNAIKSFTKV